MFGGSEREYQVGEPRESESKILSSYLIKLLYFIQLIGIIFYEIIFLITIK